MTREHQLTQARKGLALLFRPGEIRELRAMDVKGSGTVSGYFDSDHLDEMAATAVDLSGRTPGVYVTVNPVVPAVFPRSPNRVRRYARKGEQTTDEQIARRRWVLVDVDAVNPSGTSATDEQVRWACDRAANVSAWMREEHGWPHELANFSGGGMHLFYPCDLPNDPAACKAITTLLQALHREFTDEQAKIDVTCFNASRIVRVPGTLNQKGDAINGCVHRFACVLHPRGTQ